MTSSRPMQPGPARTFELSFMDGGGELGALMRAHDWSKTPLGPAARWPNSLKTAVRIMLTSRQPFWLGWGPELTYLYNDAYKSVIGGKHPRAFGQPFREVWSEIWDVAGPLADKVMNHNEGSYNESQLLIMQRHGYREETYYTFSYSPVPNDDGSPGGLICANTDDTQRVIGERQLDTVRELALRTADARTLQEACRLGVEALASNARDLPFTLIYLGDSPGRLPTLAAASPDTGALTAQSLWPLLDVMSSDALRVVPLDSLSGHIPRGAWAEPPARAAVLPLSSAQGAWKGVLVAGLNPFRQLDEAYKGFLELIARQVAAGIANADAYQQERRRAESLAQLDQAKTAFFSNVSHEFRTPLTLMLGPVQDGLSDTHHPLPGLQQERLKLVLRNGLRLQKLVNTLLDFARIEAGRVEAVYEPVDLDALTRDLASSFRSAAEQAGLSFVVDCRPLDAPVFVDRDMWENIVLNLLSNAFKFTLSGGIEIRLSADRGYAVMEVADTGAGIPGHELPRLFERFHRVAGTRGRTHEGSGIGLALVQELVKLHGGAIDVTSEPGRGSTFSVRLPLGSAHLPVGKVVARRAHGAGASRAGAFVEEALRWLPGESEPRRATNETPLDGDRRFAATFGARILLADDNADMRRYLDSLLSPYYQVEAVADGDQALAAARREPPALILSDVMMPGTDGFGLLAALRADPALRRVPVVLLSARAGEEARIEGLDAGADDYLVKPFTARELLARVGALLELQQMRRAAEEESHRALVQQRETLLEMDRQKDEFLAMLAHELRNPLAPIRNAGELLARTSAQTNGTAQAAIGIVRRQVAHLTRLVDDLLDVSRITQGRIELRRRAVRVADVVAEAVETVGPLLREKGHRVSVTSSYRPLQVDGDPERLVQCVANILANAAKYSDEGGEIRIETAEDKGCAVIRVADNGLGISPELLPRVFDLFVQGQRTLDRAEGGLGIGLSVVKRLVEMHDGQVRAASAGLEQGSTFEIRLPLIEDAPPPVCAPEPDGFPALRILIADDNVDAAGSLAMLLEISGSEVRVARDGVEAVEVAGAFRPQVIFMDIGMPRMDGFEATRRIRAQPWGRKTAIVALTGWGQQADRERSQAAGVDHHLVKPAAMEDVQRLLARIARGADKG